LNLQNLPTLNDASQNNGSLSADHPCLTGKHCGTKNDDGAIPVGVGLNDFDLSCQENIEWNGVITLSVQNLSHLNGT
jgi:hypothetical protein